MTPGMNVTELIRENRRDKPVVGCFPLYPPVELFESFGFLPVVLWNLKGSLKQLTASDKHIQQYACGIARELAQFVMADTGDLFDAIFSYNACDTLRNLPEILKIANTQAGRNVPMFRMHLPQVDPNQSNPVAYLKNEIDLLIQSIESTNNTTFSPDTFKRITENYKTMRTFCRQAEALVAEGSLSFESFCRGVLSCYALPVETQIETLIKLINKAITVRATKEQGGSEKKVVISGIMPPPLPVIRAMEAKGLRVVGNDIASLKRTYACDAAPTDNPYDYYVDLFTNRFPCTTLLYTADARVNELLNLVSGTEAKGVIFCGEKFCEHEYFEFPYLKEKLSEKGISSLFLEFSVDDAQHVEAHITRVEAFSEIINDRCH